MKKTLLALLLVLTLCLSCFVACSEKGDKDRKRERDDKTEKNTEDVEDGGSDESTESEKNEWCEHDFIKHGAKEPSCTEIGWDEYVTCSKCGYTTYLERSALGHDLSNGKCSRCEYTYSDGLEFVSFGDGTCYVSGIGTCTDATVIIPTLSPDGDTVIGIGPEAFSGCNTITGIEVPDSLFRISENAFSGCESIVYNVYANAYYFGNETNPFLILVCKHNSYIVF